MPTASYSAEALGARSFLSGWREAVLIVRKLEPWVETLTVVGGWEVAARIGPDTSLNHFWALPEGARTEQVLMRNVGTHTGFIRLVKVTGIDQSLMRPDDQAWESGGLQAIDIRVVDLESTRRALHERGWRAPSDPVRYKAYGLEVIQWAPTSPDGVRLSFIQRIAPPLEGWAELKRWGRVINAAITVKDMGVAKSFFGGSLEMAVGGATNTVGAGGPNVMGLPWRFASEAPVEIRGFYGGASGDGSVELISIPSALGRDFSGTTQPPNLGIAALRFVVSDLAGTAARLKGKGLAFLSPVQDLDVQGYGRKGCAILATDGVRLEIVEAST